MQIREFRSLSLIKSHYKISTKAVISRLNCVLPLIVSSCMVLLLMSIRSLMGLVHEYLRRPIMQSIGILYCIYFRRWIFSYIGELGRRLH